MSEPTDYGTLAPLVKAVGWLMSSAIAIGLTWRRRARWEPSEEDLSQGPARVSGLITAVFIALLWTQMATQQSSEPLVRLAVYLAVATLLALLIYGFLISTLTYKRVYSPKENQTIEQKVVGGFRLTPSARAALYQKPGMTIQRIYEGETYDADSVWTRGSRALAKLCFVLCYIVLTVSGSLALAAAAILLLLRTTT